MPAATKNMPNPANNPVTDNVRAALRAFTPAGLPAHARALLNALGYTSERTHDLGGSPQNLLAFRSSAQRAAPTKSEQSFLEVAKSAHIIFQYTDQEMESSGQLTLLEGAAFEYGRAQSFLFIAVELTPGEYARGKYAEMTREISKRFAMPVCVLFENGGRITLAFAHRRESKRRGETRDILGKVSLIRDVNCADPHRAHLDILAELALAHRFGWIASNNKQKNFDGLLQAWQAVLDTEELNKRFYRDMFKWFEWAVGEAKFPKRENKTVPAEDHVIRLITRILFVWFIKEKRLVVEELFNEAQIAPLLKNYDRKKGDDYYRAVLQNLFFATLNTEIGKRGFSKGAGATHRNFNLLRYKDLLADPKALLRLLSQTPFINGGLFDCLDSEEGQSDGGYRIDCFSDHPPHRKLISVPNRLFFDGERGLFSLLRKYKFTVEENTPIEQEVALDPELLGKIFENLLAAYNPETRGSVRKQTGSYYTPRAIVDYMVDEALVASISQKAMPASGDAEFFEKRLRYLLNYADAGDAAELFDARARREIIRAISQITALDPAAGSGAFPMGILHRLTYALRRLDPGNEIWRKLQSDRAEEHNREAYKRDKKTRDEELLEISKTFENYTGDFGRKLYLIQNSIFGVDIQPVACLIAKLRFFISLAIEQKPNNDSADNFGIKPLPNLETRFVSADALIGLRVTERGGIRHADISGLEEELRQNRERHFNAGNRREKLACGAADKKLRRKLGKALEEHYRRDADWNAARRIVEAGLETLRRELAKCQSMQSAVQQDTFLPDEREQGDWQGEIAQLQAKKKTGEKLLADIRRKDKSVKTRELWKEAEQTARAEGKLIDDEAQKLSAWDPYDQNASAEWFDAEWMFGVAGGFDVVIGNPPYVQLQKDGGRLGDRYCGCNYAVFARSGDIYQLFYELGMNLLKDGAGMLAFITSNSWMRARYGEKLREFFIEHHSPRQLIDVGKDAFDSIVDTNILLVGRGNAGRAFKAVDMDAITDGEFPPAAQHWSAMQPHGEMAWSILPPLGAKLKERVETIGMPLQDWDVKITYGIKTGYNDAFIIDQDKRDELIAADPKSAEILKPVLRGRDIQRFQARWAGLWMVYARRGIALKRYKAIEKHLRQHHAALSNRAGANEWYELQASPSDEADALYAREKLIWIELVDKGRFAYDNTASYCEATTFMMTGQSTKYLCAMLNSHLVHWYLSQIAPTSGMGTLRWKKVYVEKIPVPMPDKPAQRPLTKLVDQILAAKSKNPDADTAALEATIDQLVYQLYQLTPAEIAIVEQTRAPA